MHFRVSRFGWLPDLPDHRDQPYAAPVKMIGALPAKTDLRPQCPPVYNQGQLGSCTANAIAGAIQFDRRKQKLASDFTPSRLFIYYNERVIEHSVASDSGAQIRDGIKSVARQGDCPETEWPYVVARFKTKPSAKCYADARKYKVILYQRVTQTLSQLKGCLASGFPFVFGFTVYESFESASVVKTGHAPAAPQRRRRHRRPRGGRRRLRGRETVVHRPQFVGRRLGHEGLFHAALRLRHRRQPGRRFLDDSDCPMNIRNQKQINL